MSEEPKGKESMKQATIWNTMEFPLLLRHPLLQVAFQLVLQNIEGYLSASYRDAGMKNSTDHEKVLMNLPGRFAIEELKNETYGPTLSGVGIIFNKILVDCSTHHLNSYFLGRKFTRIGEGLLQALLDNPNIFTHVAILQQTLEHELGHLKYHYEGVQTVKNGQPGFGGTFEKRIPKKLRYEAGYAVQQRIREDHFGESASAAESKVLELEGEDLRFHPPLNRAPTRQA